MNEEMKANRGDTIHHSRPLQIFQPTVFIVVQKGHFLSSLLMTFLTFVLSYPIKLRAYILKARIWTPTIPQKNLNFPQICPKMPQNGPKMAKNDPKCPKWPKYDPKWPKNQGRIYALFLQFFSTEKVVPLTFSLLECMQIHTACK